MDDHSSDSMERILKVLELMKSTQKEDNVPPEGYREKGRDDMNRPIYRYDDAYYDSCIQDSALRSLKAVIPHLDYGYRKNISIMIKLIEIQKLQNHYEGLQGSGESRDTGMISSRRDMIRAICPHVSEKKVKKLEMLEKMLDMEDIIMTMKEMQ